MKYLLLLMVLATSSVWAGNNNFIVTPGSQCNSIFIYNSSRSDYLYKFGGATHHYGYGSIGDLYLECPITTVADLGYKRNVMTRITFSATGQSGSQFSCYLYGYNQFGQSVAVTSNNYRSMYVNSAGRASAVWTIEDNKEKYRTLSLFCRIPPRSAVTAIHYHQYWDN